jgi:putative aldouronate transport system substrate-binding protein
MLSVYNNFFKESGMKTRRFFWGICFLAGFGIFSGCGKKSETGNEAVREITVTEESGPSWRQDKTPYTLKWFVAYDWYGKTFNPKVNLGDRHILEETGISLEIDSGNYEKLNLLISTGDLPDLVTFDAVSSQRTLLEDGGVLYDLEELSAKYAPDLNVPQSMKDWYRAKDGKWYTIASYYYGPERTSAEFGGYYATHNLNYARQDILDQTGMRLENMKTKAGFLNALREVKRRNIQYGGKTVLPYIGADPANLAAQFGADLEDKDGNLADIRRTPEYLEALLYLNTMFNEGLITDEEFTMNTQMRDQKTANGEVFAASGWLTVSLPRKSLYTLDGNAKFMYAGIINGGDSGKTPVLEAVSCGGWTGTMIAKNCRNPVKAIQFMAYMTSEKATLDQWYGYGTYDIVNGKVVRKPEKEKEYEENYQAAYAKYNLNIEYFVDWTIIEKYTGFNPHALYYDIDHYNQEHDRSITMYDNKAFTFVAPEDGSDLSVMDLRVEDYWKQQIPKMIMAKNSDECARIYRDSLAQADSLGMKAVDDYQNQRFIENKKRLGVQRVWPR